MKFSGWNFIRDDCPDSYFLQTAQYGRRYFRFDVKIFLSDSFTGTEGGEQRVQGTFSFIVSEHLVYFLPSFLLPSFLNE